MSFRKKVIISLLLFLVAVMGLYYWRYEDIIKYKDDLIYYTMRHISLVLWSMLLAIAVGVSAGVILSRKKLSGAANKIIQLFNIGNTVPTMAVLALSLVVVGIGDGPAIFALFMASLLPIVRNSFEGLKQISPALLESAKGVGMTPWQSLLKVEIPNAVPVMLAGVRTSLAINVGTAPLSFLIGGDSLGGLIFPGIYLNNQNQLLLGAITTAVLALSMDGLIVVAGHAYLRKRGLV